MGSVDDRCDPVGTIYFSVNCLMRFQRACAMLLWTLGKVDLTMFQSRPEAK